MKTRTGFLSLILVLGMGCLLLSGCGDGRPSRVKVSGNVTIDGKPVTGGIQFFPSAGGRRGGGTIKDGRYTAMMYTPDDGLPTGDYRIAIISNQDVNELTVRWLIPEKYADIETSQLTASITEETDAMNFEVTWEGDEHGEPYEIKQR